MKIIAGWIPPPREPTQWLRRRIIVIAVLIACGAMIVAIAFG
jgi:hypothetical protein